MIRDTNQISFQTDRIDARPWNEFSADRNDAFSRLNALLDGEVLAPLPPSLQRGGEPVEEWMRARQLESDVIALGLRNSRDLIGLMVVALSGQLDHPDIHIGYLIGKEHWGQGFASEALEGLVQTLKASGPAQLIGGVDANNRASVRVLEKAGFELEAQDPTSGVRHYVLNIE